MNKPRWAVLLSTLFLPFSLQSAPLPFVVAWDVVQANNNALRAEQANVERYAHLNKASDSLDLPSLSVSANYTYLDQAITLSGRQIAQSAELPAAALGSLAALESTITKQEIVSSSIRAVWPIFTGGKIDAAQSAAQGQYVEAQSQLALETQARFEDLARYYFAVVLAKEVLLTRQQVEKGLQQHNENADKLFQQGQIAQIEALQATASLDKATIERKKAEKDRDIAARALSNALGTTDVVETVDSLFINRELPPLNVFSAQTEATYPGLDLLDAKKQLASSLLQSEKSKYWPQVYLYSSYSLYEDDTLASQLKPDWMVGIGVSLPLVDTSGRGERVDAASQALVQLRYKRAQAISDLQLLVEKTYLEAQQASDEVDGLKSTIQLAKDNLDLRNKAFAQGLSTSLDVVDAELYLASIQTQRAVASYHYLIALCKLLALSDQIPQFSDYQRHASIVLSAKAD